MNKSRAVLVEEFEGDFMVYSTLAKMKFCLAREPTDCCLPANQPTRYEISNEAEEIEQLKWSLQCQL